MWLNTRYIKRIIVILLAIFIFFVIKPLFFLFNWGLLFETNLLVLINENEARPCGGFITGVGEIRIFPPKLSLQNPYNLPEHNFAHLPNSPLEKVSPTSKFWDSTDLNNTQECAEKIKSQYLEITKNPLNEVIMINFSVLESWMEILNSITIDENKITVDDFFQTLSRKSANVDRHDEEVLENRKYFLNNVFKKMIIKNLWQVWKWTRFTNLIGKNVREGSIYIPNKSQIIAPQKNDFGVVEWNLGGGKTSRSLYKKLTITAIESRPHFWTITMKFNAQNLSGNQEPIGQKWQGFFEFLLPKYSGRVFSEMVEAEIMPNKDFNWREDFYFEGDLFDLDIFVPRGQEIFSEVFISSFPEQILLSDDLKTRENHGTWQKRLNQGQKKLTWKMKKDELPPFLTLHEKISSRNLEPDIRFELGRTDFLVEIHFNEPVEILSNFEVKLIDKNFQNKDILSNMDLKSHKLLRDKKTLILNFTQKIKQPLERYKLKLNGVSDMWGNQFIEKSNTVIDK